MPCSPRSCGSDLTTSRNASAERWSSNTLKLMVLVASAERVQWPDTDPVFLDSLRARWYPVFSAEGAADCLGN